MSQGPSFSDRLARAVARAGGRGQMLRAVGVADRTLGHYLEGKTEPKASVAAQLARAGRVRLEWLIEGVEPMEQGGEATAPRPAATLHALDLGRLAAAIAAVDTRMPLLGADAKARAATALYEHMAARGTSDAAAVGAFLDLIAGTVPASSYRLPEPMSDEERIAAARVHKRKRRTS